MEGLRLVSLLTNVRSRIYFDLETGGLFEEKGILQIAARFEDKIFNEYVIPVSEISREASKVNGITFTDGNLKVNGNVVPSISIKIALERFILWLSGIGTCDLIGHNVIFDLRFIIHYLELYNLKDQFCEYVYGYIDTLPLFKFILPGEKSYKQDLLVHEYLESNYKLHNALGDVTALEDLIKKFQISDEVFTENTQAISSYCCKRSLKTLVDMKIIPARLVNEMSEHDIGLEKLISCYQSQNYSSINNIISEDRIKKINSFFIQNPNFNNRK